jgi:hypothetical protein
MLLSKYVVIPMISHGITDLIDYPRKTLLTYGVLTPILSQLNINQQFILLMGSSIYHMKKDIPFNIKGSIVLHGLWLYEPIIAPYFLCYIHSPRHYLRTLKAKPIQKLICISLMCIISNYMIDNLFILSKYFGPLWWSPFVLCHIVIHDILSNFNPKKESIKCSIWSWVISI